MTQDMNHTFGKALRAVFVATVMSLTGSNALAQVTVNGSVYGGGNAADVGVDATVNIAGGTMVNVYGGGKGQNTTVVGDVKVNIGKFIKTTNSGTETVTGIATITGSVYGGSALGTVNAQVTKDPTTGEITNRVASANKSTSVNIYRSTINGSVFGGGEGDDDEDNSIEAKVCKKVIVTIGTSAADDNPTIEGSVYGGCNANGVLWEKSEVNVVRGTIGSTDTDNDLVNGSGNVHGGGFGQKTLVMGDVEVNIGATDGAETPTYSGAAIILGDVYGGSAQGNVNATPNSSDILEATSTSVRTDVNLYGGTVNGDVYGGGLGALGEGTSGQEGYVAPIAANVYGPVTVGIYGGTAQNVYGCNNLNGAPQSTATVNIEDGTINKNVFGGGNLANAPGTILVIIKGGSVTNDVYGGGALANTNTANTDNTSAHTTNVFLLGGIIGHNVYGGGLGEKDKVNGATADNPAYVNGDVKVCLNGLLQADATSIYTSLLKTDMIDADGDGTGDYYPVLDNTGCVVKGSIFGCNNLCGTPRGDVKVYVFKTKGDTETKRTEPGKITSTTASDHSYEVAAVYGGGDMAAYEPTNAFSDDETIKASAKTNVYIYGCNDTSIGQVYGGGNAASTPATEVNIYGTYEISELFGGGNGAGKVTINNTQYDNPGANVGFKEYGAAWVTYDTNKPFDTSANRATYYGYGSGKANVNIYGGTIHAIYGGSNTKGNVREVALAMLEEIKQDENPVCPMAVDEAYGGGKSADMDGKAILNLGCIPGLTNVYGGARAATVNNDVELNITNGTYQNVFGGNNESGKINGSITVNIEETGCRPIHITNLYGGGNKAAYPGEGATVADAKKKIQVNVKSCTSIGNVFGGGLGTTAIVTGTTEVNINQVEGKFSTSREDYTQNIYGDTEVEGLGTIGNVYGGGSQGDVDGSTNVNIGTKATVTYVTGTDTTTPNDVQGANITGSVYGGGLSADVQGNSTVKIGTVALDEDATGVKIGKDVFGGGEGATTNVSGDVLVEIGKDNGDNTYTGDATIGTDTYAGSVYGGSALGTVNTEAKEASGDNPATPASGTVKVKLHKGTVKGAVYGGGMGVASTPAVSGTGGNPDTPANPGTEAKVFGNATVTLYGDVVTGGLYGGCNLNGTMYGNTELNLYGGTVGTVLAAGAEAPDMVFGGGLGKDTKVNGNVTVNIGNADNAGAKIYSNVYGGSAKGIVNSSTSNTTEVNLFKGIVYGNVFGGGLGDAQNAATVKGNVTVKLNENDGTCEVTGSIFGCNNTKGSPEGHVTVHVYKTVKTGNTKDLTKTTLDARWSEDATYDLAAVYGGGNKADYEPTSVTDFAEVIIDGCNETSIKEVYGGGYGAAVPATQVKILGTYLINEVFGGGYGAGANNDGANVGYYTYKNEAEKTGYGSGKSQVKLYGGMVHTAYGGSNTKGNIRVGSSAGKATDIVVTCSLAVKNIYGAGKNADQDGGTDLVIGCIPELKNVYGGARDANIRGGVNLVITGGDFENVFGGNDTSGTIQGPIKVFIEEECAAINIQNLYLGGNLAAYSVYGYYKDTNNKLQPRTSATDTTHPVADGTTAPDATTGQYPDPQLYVTKFTTINNVYGGGLGSRAVMYGNPKVNINEVKNLDGNIGEIGNVYGGGDAANVEGNTTVNIGTEKYAMLYNITDGETDVRGYYIYDESDDKYTEVTGDAEVAATENTSYYKKVIGANITGNVFGGGNKADVSGNTFVNICAVLDPVLGTDSKPTGDYTYTPVDHSETTDFEGISIEESVYGGGSEADVKGNTRVTMTDGYVFDGVYGGGLQGSVGTFTRALPSGHPEHDGCVGGKPETWSSGGKCTVVISGGQIGPVEAALANGGMKNTGRYFKEDGDPDGPVDVGFVFGAGRGEVENPADDPDVDFHTYVKETEVTISGTALIMASVYGGGENGRVRGNTKVKIEGGQIGCGVGMVDANNKPIRYTDDQFVNPVATTITDGDGGNALAECASWDYGKVYQGETEKKWLPYDPLADKPYKGSTAAVTDANKVGSDGHTYYGSVFGGGSGYYPYENTDGTHDWLESAGLVEGDTEVEITGGHILTSVYGGNELTNVNGTCKVKMSGGTLGVPRTLDQIINHPVTCYLLGAGKGDQRTHFNKWTNVGKVIVEINDSISQPIIYGSVFGGGEDGHVTGNVYVNIKTMNGKDPIIGTWGTSYVDGNVFGGGRGYGGTAYTAGNVAGNVFMDISGGKILGSIYGGGRLGSVGYDLINAGDDGYGIMSNDENRGHVNISISGGTIGNNIEYKYPSDDEKSATGNLRFTSYDSDNKLTHTKGGNVFAGGMGRRFKLDGTTEISEATDGIDWKKLGNVKSAKLTISGNAVIKSNIYGGGELGALTGSHTTEGKDWGAEISITGGTIGTDIGTGDDKYYFGSVYGGGMGNETYGGGDVASNTNVSMTSGKVLASVYGGGEIAVVEGSTDVTVGGGEIGHTKDGDMQYGGATMGNVYGGGKGTLSKWDAGLIKGNTKVTINAGSNGEPKIYHNIYGGGAYGSVGTITTGNATYVPGIASVSDMPTAWVRKTGDTGVNTGTAEVYVYGGTIGVDGNENGMVFGSSRGDVGTPDANGVDPNNRLAWVHDTKVVIGGEGKSPIIKGSAYGSGENGHVFENTIVEIHNGTIGVTTDDAFGGPNYRLRGNVYGGGCGEDTYPDTDDFNPLAGIVLGTANVTIDGGQVAHNVYGAGALGSVVGKTTVTIAGSAIIGVKDAEGGNVFGAARGKEGITVPGSNLANSPETEVDINGGQVWNSVFGGGENGYVKQNVVVNMNGGIVAKDVYGGGALADTNSDNWDATKNEGAGGWATGKVDADGKTTYNTTVNLFGGMIKGDAYGGGLGRLESGTSGQTGYVAPIEAKVYGDVFVNQGKENDESKITAYTITYLNTKDLQKDANGNTIEGKYVQVVNSGRIFGCNNLNGSPIGNVTVTVNGTTTGKDGAGNDISRTSITRDETTKEVTSVGTPHTYEVAAVYGGGNLADYTPTEGAVKVIINSCNVSVEEVYGGGNAAMVPGTDVLVNGAHEIEQVFGGGNGADKFTLDGGTTWKVNPGANVNGDANTMLKGGLIHEAYGGSNEKGTITGNITIDTGTGGLADCPVQVDKLVGAGKNADVNGDLIMILGCKNGLKIPLVYGGADNANVNGNVELTVTSGNFGQVFGGNNEGGAILGHIILNIEETSQCEPINIEELYLGGNNASYSRYGYYVETTKTGGTPVGAPDEDAVLVNDKLHLIPRESASDTHKPVKSYSYDTEHSKWTWEVYPITGEGAFIPYAEPELNVVSCTSVGTVFGGGYGEGGDMYANPTVNINMIPGRHADGVPTVMTAKGLATADNPKNLGIIGDVFGGGNAADVNGNPTVNIGTGQTVLLHKAYNASTKEYTTEEKDVDGAYITGNVFGGGKLANVGKTHLETEDGTTVDKIDIKGSTHVNIAARYNETTTKWESVDGLAVTVGGNVYGGGQGEALESGDGAFRCGKAMITESTNVTIGNGTVEGTVYGGGKVGRVEENTTVTIGIKFEGETSTPTSLPVIKGNVFGAGAGVNTHGYAALVRGTSTVTVQGGAQVKQSVYGGGEIASVGRYAVADEAYHTAHPAVEEGLPYSLADPDNVESGMCIVNVWDKAVIGPDYKMEMKKDGGPDDIGHVFGAGKGVLPYEGYTHDAVAWRMQPNNTKETYLSWNQAESGTSETAYLKFIESMALATETFVTIGGDAFVKGSVYGGSENGHVQYSTHVTIQDNCQIGSGKNTTERHPDAVWGADYSVPEGTDLECASWDYDASSGAPYDMFAKYSQTVDGKVKYYYDASYTKSAEGGYYIAKDGHTYYGNVFGGGSGVIPYRPGKWHREAGSVGRNTTVNITGGHILTSVYGGNEQTDVGAYTLDSNGQPTIPAHDGKCTVNMVGGTLGVPRTLAQIAAHPVTCYLFGAGKGDQRIFFNTWTNVIETEVNISGKARIYGSTFGGGEDGHILKDAVTNIGGEVTIGTGTAAKTYTENGVIIGTTGTSYVDGNIFGGGRGFSGEAQTAGTVGGNIKINIKDGKILGSIYGGGRLASVGTMFTNPESEFYGQFREDDDDGTYGHITINISGGTIGNDAEDIKPKSSNIPNTITESDFKKWTDDDWKKWKTYNGVPQTLYDKTTGLLSHSTGGNVFGGSMGRLTLLNGDINPLWPKLAQAKTSTIKITGGTIKHSVYGGGELGTIREDAKITIEGGTICRDVYGGGYGSDDYTTETPITVAGYAQTDYTFTPMQWAGCVGGDTYVDISGGQVKKSVYGGGEMASVGIINYTNAVKNDKPENGFVLSWPYKVEYIPYLDGKPVGGATHVNITGGRIGAKKNVDPEFDTDNGDVYGAGKGIAGDYNDYVFCANVRSTDVIINLDSDGVTPKNFEEGGNCIAGAVYGGGENGHVMEDTKLTITDGLIGHSIYGGGSGKGTFSQKLLKIGKTAGSTNEDDYYIRDIYSITAGKVFGNTEVNVAGGHVVRNVYGGGNMGSVGKGNYAGGADDYSEAGYGEKVSGNLWDGESEFSKAFLNSGKCEVNITGGTIGYIDESDPSNSMYPWNSTASLPYGNVFGGCRGESAPNISESPRYLYSPEFFVGYANETLVTIEGDNTKILGSVYGGGMDGHLRRDAHVIINGGEIGLPFTDANKGILGTDPNNLQWLARGNVYGAGSGIGKYKYDFDYDNDYDSKTPTGDNTTYHGNPIKEEDYSTSAGSVTRFTKVEVKGGNIHRNVYGGGSLASVGAPKIGQEYDEYRRGDTAEGHGQGKQTLNEVIISGGKIGDDLISYDANDFHVYGGMVYGGSRGDISLGNRFSTALYTSMSITGDADIKGDVYGGGEAGTVKGDVDVEMTSGNVHHDIYGGGALADTQTSNWNATGGTDGNGDWADATNKSALHKTTVNLTGGTISGNAYGGALGQVEVGTSGQNGYVAPIEAYVYGDVTVKLNEGKTADNTGCIVNKVFGCNNLNGTPKGHVQVYVYATQNKDVATYPKIGSNKTGSRHDGFEDEDSETTYDLAAVYGGGNLSPYDPVDAYSTDDAVKKAAQSEVYIYGCDLTSIKQVYGGGNAAPAPATYVRVDGVYEIEELFGGGNGKDNYVIDGKWYLNPGANVGYKNYTHLDGTGDGSKTKPYNCVENDNAKTKEGRQTAANGYMYGSGVAHIEVFGGTIHASYGGSNEKGNISTMAWSKYEEGGTCDLNVAETYGGGKNSLIDGEIVLDLGCTTYMPTIFGGSKNADVNSDIVLNVTNGKYDQVFGGNNTSGKINGSITVNIKEEGCVPIEIGELYLGGYLAPYSIYGYQADGTPLKKGDEGALTTPRKQPHLNVISATSIGTIYGGGYKATVVGDPHVNVNMEQGKVEVSKTLKEGTTDEYIYKDGGNNVYAADKYTIEQVGQKYYAILPIGTIGNIYGGGNEADIIGDTNVEIGTGTQHNDAGEIVTISPARNAAKITGNVFGGGKGVADDFECEKAMVGVADSGTGSTNVTIGNGTVEGSVYGGGEVGRVEAHTNVTIGLAGDETNEPVIQGNVFGAGAGVATHGYSALVRGDATVTVQGKAKVEKSVYGGGEIATVGRYKVVGGLPTDPVSGGECTIVIKDNAEVAKDVFGAGKGVDPVYDANNKPQKMNASSGWDTLDSEEAYLSFLETLALASKTDVTIDGSASVKGNVYGGSESGFVHDNTSVTIQGNSEIGTADADSKDTDGNVFGGGKGVAIFFSAGRVLGNTSLQINGGTMHGTVYGGGELGYIGKVTVSPDYRTFSWVDGTGVSNVTINGSTAIVKGHVFGAGKGLEDTFWCEKGIAYGTNVNISSGTVNGNVYGGGEVGRVETNAVVKIGPDSGTGSPVIKGNVFGAGAGKETHGYSALVRGNTEVTIQGGAKVEKSVYGGGEIAAVGKYYLVDAQYKQDHPESKLEIGMPYSLVDDGLGICHVTVKGNAEITENVFGAGEGLVPRDYTYADNAHRPKRMMSYNTALFTEDNKAIWEFVDANEQYVWEYFDTKSKYLTFIETLALTTQSIVNIDGSAKVKGNVYGGSESGFVHANTSVTVQGNSTIGTTDTNGNNIDGNVFGGGLGYALFAEAGRVSGNTTVNVNGGTMKGNVYGGGSLGDVGTITKNTTDYNYTWTDQDGKANGTNIAKNTGVCTVNITDGEIAGHVFGAGKGLDDTFWCEKAMAYSTNVNISNGKVNGNVYGGGQLGRVENNAVVTIGDGTSEPVIKGNVFGAGAGVATHGYSALVRGDATVTVQGKAKVGKSVYGGGETASVGRFKVVNSLPTEPLSGGTCTVKIQGSAEIGSEGEGYVFGACKGVDPDYEHNEGHVINTGESKAFANEAEYLAFLKTLALTSNTHVTIGGNASVNGSVFGGGQRGIALGNVDVNMTGGTVTKDVYGGGALADTNTGNATDYDTSDETISSTSTYTTTVNLLGGTIGGEAYGGGLGEKTGVNDATSDVEAIVYGDVLVELNKGVAEDAKGCIVDKVFGANNINGTPKGHVTVHVYATQNKDLADIGTKSNIDGVYDVSYVFGGGNAADYVPTAADTKQSTEVIIEGCDLTSIQEVYGGGYGAATPATSILVKGTKIIDNVYGGGYGAGTDNPGANVGYKTKNRSEYGSGKAVVQLMAGTINNVYGGSNTKGDIRDGSSVTNVTNDGGPGCCEKLSVEEIYGGGKSADMYGGAEICLSCMPNDWIGAIYAGAEKADVGNDISLTLTSGKFERVYGGNKSGGKIDGYIEVNIEENPECSTPIIIGELYGGGNEASYEYSNLAKDPDYPSPRVNVRAFTSIGTIYGGGYGKTAIVTGNPTVNINVVEGGREYAGDTRDLEDGSKVTLYARSKDGKIGVIGNVFGGGNAAEVKGNTTVNIGTTTEEQMVSLQTTDEQGNVIIVKKPVVGADIRGNVYGGGNNAGVSGNTNVVVGKKKE